ncbi:dihydrofolate reductase family protein [Tunturiibacter gelidoferens]|uniref:Dihydrofolate reductase n=1 Tax=Tunturiibacter gelidiferens TaxID=3069689 RepID=A0ACC5NXQ6_9BACT|nr:dihydrofolate reductase family protein [Edaphobacter lichenicola]MBB5339379.1 dihydrofolate reductase [Edaphobacter lichenicola]
MASAIVLPIMRLVKLSVACSLDGFLEGPDGGIDWIRGGADYGMEAFLASLDTTLIGRRTFEFARRSGNKFFPSMTNYVFSTSLPSGVMDEVEVVGGDAVDFVSGLKKRRTGRDLWLFGGHELIASMLRSRLVDEILLTVHPVLLGGGLPLFGSFAERQELKLVEAKPLKNGVVMLSYRAIVRAGQ